MYTLSLYIIGIVGTVLNGCCLLFNLISTIVLLRCRKELFQNPFFKMAAHLIVAEVAISIAQLCIISPNLFTGIAFETHYYDSFAVMAIPNAIMMLCYDCYYYLQFLIAVYRFMTIHHRSKFFDNWTLHAFCAVIWCWCLFEGAVMMTGYCAKMYRPRHHFVGIICADHTDNAVREDVFRFFMINLLQGLNFLLPLVCMIVYLGLYLKICMYQAVNNAPLRVASLNDTPEKPLSVKQRLFLTVSQSGRITNRNHVRIVYQGLFMIILLAGEPLFNLICTHVGRPVDNIGYQILAYALIYSTVPTNFLVFFVFNMQMRRCIKIQIWQFFGWKYKPKHQRKTISSVV